MDPLELDDADRFITLARQDWVVSKSWNRLHAVLEWTQEHRDDMTAAGAVLRPVRLACGRTAAQVHIPGFGTRLGAMRCEGCCRKLGYGYGVGSPKNDDALRPLLGLTVP